MTRAAELRENLKKWQELLDLHAGLPKFSGKYAVKVTKKPAKKTLVLPEVPRLPSRVTPGGTTAPRPTRVYTGDRMLGITVIHKSCLQPVFSQEEAVAAATMRR